MKRKIFILAILGTVFCSSVLTGVLANSSNNNLTDNTTYRSVDLKFWNDLDHNSHLGYQKYVNSTTEQSNDMTVGHHDTHHYQQAIITSDETASQTVVLDTQAHSSFYPEFAEFDFYLKSQYKANDTFLKDTHRTDANGNPGDLIGLNNKKEIDNVTGFSIRDRANTGHGYLYLTIFYGNNLSLTGKYELYDES